MNTNLTIRQLNSKVRTLQNDLSQRTRNFLLHRGLRAIITTQKADQYVQTDLNYSEMQSNPSYLQGLSSAYESGYSSQLKQENTAFSRINISQFFFNQNQEISQNRQKITEIIQQLREFQKISQSSNSEVNIEDDFLPQESQPQAFNREKRRLKREIKKLSQKLAFQQKISQIAKEALLVSQEENYQFRLKIMELTKNRYCQDFQIQIDENPVLSCQIETLKNQITNLEENLNHERQLNRQHLQSSLQILEQINQLFQENGSLKKLITDLQLKQAFHSETKTDDHSSDQPRNNQEVLERIKSTAFSISNCIPVTYQSQNVNYFRPQTDEEVLEVLKRAQEYCKQIEKWQIQRIQSIARQKRLFVDVLNKIALHIDKQTKETLQEQLVKIEDMSHFLSAFKEKEQKTSHLYLQSLKNHTIQIQKIIPA